MIVLPYPGLHHLPKCDPVPLPLLAKGGPSSNWLHAEDDGGSGEEAEGDQGTSDSHVRVSQKHVCMFVLMQFSMYKCIHNNYIII